MSLNPLLRWRSLWLSSLAKQFAELINGFDIEPPPAKSEVSHKYLAVFIDSIYEQLYSLAHEFNRHLQTTHLRISVIAPETTKETDKPGQPAPESYLRCRASTAAWSLSVRACKGLVEFFLVPVRDLIVLSKAEQDSKLLCKLYLSQDGMFWLKDGLPLSDLEIEVLVKDLFKQLVLAPMRTQESPELENFSNLKGEALTHAIRQLILDKQNLVQKIITQQEEMQKGISRELHDAVISDVLMVKRAFSGDKRLSDEELLEVLDQITHKLRDICHELAPRDLIDWGLPTVIDDMLQRSAERSGCDCSFDHQGELPDLPQAVQLHIYRIVQEALNNIEKYSQASLVRVSLTCSNNELKLTIEDNGQGFEPDKLELRKSRQGGQGMGNLAQRAELIRCFYPARVKVESKQQEGTQVTLEITLQGATANF